jgi:hypothetical protein
MIEIIPYSAMDKIVHQGKVVDYAGRKNIFSLYEGDWRYMTCYCLEGAVAIKFLKQEKEYAVEISERSYTYDQLKNSILFYERERKLNCLN